MSAPAGRSRTYSERLGSIAPEQFQAALDRFELGDLISAEAIPFGLFGQNVRVTTSVGEFVLRGAALCEWQFPKEQLVASLLNAHSPAAAPWPYLLDLDESIFGWPHGYAVMPLLRGLQLADPEVAVSLTSQQRCAIAFALGETLRDIQRCRSRFAGRYQHQLGVFRPFSQPFPTWVVADIRQSVDRSLGRGDLTSADKEWIELRLAEAWDELSIPFVPVLVHHDYKEANLAVQFDDGKWKVSGVFDLTEAFFGDGELDLVRQFAEYVDHGEDDLAGSFLEGFRQQAPLRVGALARLGVYLIRDRMIIWDYFHRPENIDQWWYDTIAPREWLEEYLSALAGLL